MSANSEKRRLKEIVSVFIKHGIKEGITNPVQARLALEELGPTFIKIGQMLSMRPDILPESYVREFKKLQDDVTSEDFEEIKAVLERELGGPIERFFVSFEEEPIASASMAVVHRATLYNGEEVAVKIQRPKARESMLNDLSILRRITHFVKYAPRAGVLNLEEAAEELLQAAKEELDFTTEANNLKRFAEYNKDPKVRCPRVYEEFTTRDILVLQYIEGIPILNTDRLQEEGYDLQALTIKLADNYIKQIFEDGFFHADPHPGNLLVQKGAIIYLDFGMMGYLSKALKEKFNALIYSMATGNVDGMTRAVLSIGIKKGKVDRRRLYSDIEEIYNEYIETSFHEIDLPRMMEEVFVACRRNNIAIPPDLVRLAKGLVTVEGLVAKLAPDINIMDLAIPYAKRYLASKREFKKEIAEQAENLYLLTKSGTKIPVKFLELINSALAGKLKIQMEHTNLDETVNKLNKMVNRIAFSLILSSLVIGSSVVINAKVGPKLYDISIIGLVGFLSAAVMGFWLLVSILYSGKM